MTKHMKGVDHSSHQYHIARLLAALAVRAVAAKRSADEKGRTPTDADARRAQGDRMVRQPSKQRVQNDIATTASKHGR